MTSLVCAVSVATFVAACADDASEPDGGEETSAVTIALDSDLTTLDAGLQAGRQDSLTLINVYDSLLARGDDGSTQPWIVTEWTPDEGATSWTFTIRDDVTFQDGTAMTADDVAFTINRYAADAFEGALGFQFVNVDQAVVVDDTTVRVDMTNPDPFFARNIADTQSPVVQEALFEESPEEFGTSPETAVGTGPYKIAEWSPGERLVLEAFDDHWGGAPEIQRVVMNVIPDSAARTAALRAGQVDIVVALDPEQAASIDGADAVAVASQGTDRVRLSLNTNREPFSSLEVRQALNHAIDTEALIGLIGETATPIVGHALPLEVGYNPDLEDAYPFDPERAKQLLAEAGYPDGFTVKFHVRQAFPKVEEASQAVAQMLADVGITTEIVMLPSSDFQELMPTGEVDLGYTANAGGATFHVQGSMTPIFDCREGRGAASHTGYYCNEEVYRLLDEGASLLAAGDEEASTAVYEEIDQLLMDDAAQVLLYGNAQLWGISEGLDWRPGPTNAIDMLNASFTD